MHALALKGKTSPKLLRVLLPLFTLKSKGCEILASPGTPSPAYKATPRRQNHTPRHESSSVQGQNHHSHVQGPVPTPRHAFHQSSASRMKIKATTRCHTSTARRGKLSSSAKLAPRPRPGVLHQRPSVGVSKLIFYDSRLGVEPEVQA
ncbi:hypothetical protein PIB30_088751 [Stylosanthes scabra]|uniref:Uncharacterized protein n=1 Tax=Stylosanthes scabra TaxID=79078 RepID=A0ABU6RUR0_9FABA|nr:hypothetical protein [Stylosanthes scabra]